MCDFIPAWRNVILAWREIIFLCLRSVSRQHGTPWGSVPTYWLPVNDAAPHPYSVYICQSLLDSSLWILEFSIHAKHQINTQVLLLHCGSCNISVFLFCFSSRWHMLQIEEHTLLLIIQSSVQQQGVQCPQVNYMPGTLLDKKTK